MNLKLSETQIWIVAKALHMMTSDEGAEKLVKEFPYMDFERVADDVNGVLDQIADQTDDSTEEDKSRA